MDNDYFGAEQKKGFFGKIGNYLIDFIQTLVVFGAIFALIYLFVAQPHKVSGSSMVPNFRDGDYILTDKVTYRIRDPQKGDIIVFKNPNNESQDFIKRIIATPGDTVKIEDQKINLNGKQLLEDYLAPGTPTLGKSFLTEGEVVQLAENEYFVLGDNREHSSDSREWGTIGKKSMIGRAFFRYWPPKVFGLIAHSQLKFSN